jgi:predicted amidohydrolase YtcJ
MKIAKVGKDTKDPSGGKIIRDKNGYPTGVFVDDAADLILSHYPAPDEALTIKAAELAQQAASQFGVTSFHDAGVSSKDIKILEKLVANNKLNVRLNIMLDGKDQALLNNYFARGPQIGSYGNHFTIRSIKLYADGALGSRGAALAEPYSDDPNNYGLILTDQKRIADVAKAAFAHGFQVATHAIGDRANRVALDAYQSATKSVDLLRAARFRIEHAQIVNPVELARSFLNAKVPLAFGSDAPVESLNPMKGLYAAVTRRGEDDAPTAKPFYAGQALTLIEALRAFTIGGAYAEFAEKQKGMLKQGYLADFIVLDKDIMKLQPRELLSTNVQQTYVGGRRVFDAKTHFSN